MDTQLIKALEQAEKEYNKLYSDTFNRIYSGSKTYVQSEQDILVLMQSVYVEAYRTIANRPEDVNVREWLDEILSCQGEKVQENKSAEEFEEQSEELPVEIAQEVYNACCLSVGLTPTEIMVSSDDNDQNTATKEGQKTVKEKVKEKAKKVVKDEIEGAIKDEVKKGVKKVVKEVVKSGTAEEAGQAVGLIAKLAALSTKAKVLVMAGTLATSAVTVGVVGTVITSATE